MILENFLNIHKINLLFLFSVQGNLVYLILITTITLAMVETIKFKGQMMGKNFKKPFKP